MFGEFMLVLRVNLLTLLLKTEDLYHIKETVASF